MINPITLHCQGNNSSNQKIIDFVKGLSYKSDVELNDLVSQSKAAKKLGVSRQVINERIKSGTLTGYKDQFGVVRVSWAEACEYEPRKAGRPKKG